MKKILNKIVKIFSLSVLLVASSTFFSCQDPIFFEIRREVKLEEATILGDVNSIVRFTNNKIFCSNGNIYSKDQSQEKHGQWQKMSAPNGIIHKIAADKTYLYALAAEFAEDTGDGKMKVSSLKVYYSTDGNNWSYITSLNTSKTAISNLICTNAVQENNRKAYINDNGTVKLLNGSETPSAVSASSKTTSCAYLDDKTYFFEGFAACSNETSTTNADKIYYSRGGTIRIKTTTSDTDFASSHRGEVQGLAVMKDSVLAVTRSGAALIDISSKDEKNFSNITSTLSTLYEGRACLAIYPEKNADSTPVYASQTVYGTGSNSAQFTHVGLWSYYPSRGKWNIE